MLIESLERRQLLSASAVVLPGGILLVRADNGGSNLLVTERAHFVDANNMPVNRAVEVDDDSGLVGAGLFSNINKIVILGGNGNDTIDVTTQDVGTYIDGGNGNDTISVTVDPDDFDPSSGNFVFHPEYTGGCNTIFGGNGDDVITTVGLSNSVISGGNGNDQINVSAVTSNSADHPGMLVGGSNILIDGDNGDDIIAADHVSCSIVSGDNGNDKIFVSNSKYTLILGGNGADTINETDGNHDVIDGGNGTDIVAVFTSNGDIVLQSRGGDVVTYS